MPFFIKAQENLNILDLLAKINEDSNSNQHLAHHDKICDVTTLNGEKDNAVASFHNTKYIKNLANAKCKFCLIDKDFAHFLPKNVTPIFTPDPHLAFAKITAYFYPSALYEDSDVEEIAQSAQIGANTKIGHNVVIGKNVEIGKNCIIHDNCVIKYAKIGDNCTIYPGAKIGQEGFGFLFDKKAGKMITIPQIGHVEIGNNVRIGANTCIDRGSFHNTIIGNHVCIDNLCHIAHGVEIGAFTIIAAMGGIAGSTKIGSGCIFGGQVGINGHTNIGNKVTLAAKSGVFSDLADGKTYGGYPAMEIKRWHKISAIMNKLFKKYEEKREI